MPDILLVFGAAVRGRGRPSRVLKQRLEAAVAAAKRCREPLFVVSGGRGAEGPVEADVMRRTLLEFGVAESAILREPRSRDTLEQARRFAAILDELGGVERVIVCTSAFHQPRCRLLLAILGVASEAAPIPGDRKAMGVRVWLYYVAREFVATAWDVLLLVPLRLARRDRLAP